MDREKIQKYAGKCNVDVMSGWEAGLLGKERIGGKLFDRFPPDHIQGSRLDDWLMGRNAAIRLLQSRLTFFTGKTLDNQELMIKRRGWVARGPVIKLMEKRGAIGWVQVHYVEDGEIVRKHDCGL